MSQKLEESGALGGRLAGMSLSRQVLMLAFWPFLQNLLGVSVGFSDMMIAGRMGQGGEGKAIFEMMTASMYLMWLLMLLQGAMATGAMALVSRSTGAKDMQGANLALGQSVLLGVGSGGISGLIIAWSVPLMAHFFGLSSQAATLLVDYMRVACLLAPFSGILFIASSCLRGYGDSLLPFISMFLVNGINVLLSLFFVYVLDWGVVGLAAGTSVGWAMGAFFILYCLHPKHENKGRELILHVKNLRYDVPMLRRIWRVSWPSAIEIAGMWSIHAFGMHLIGRHLPHILAAHGMVVRMESLSFMPGFAIGTAASALAGQYLGAGNPKGAVHAVRYCWVLGLLIMGGAGLLMSIFSREFLSLFGQAGLEQMALAAPVVRFVGGVQVFTATALVLKFSMRGTGDTGRVTIYAFISMILVRVLLFSWVLFHRKIGMLVVWQIFALDALLQSILFSILHFQGKWLKKEV